MNDMRSLLKYLEEKNLKGLNIARDANPPKVVVFVARFLCGTRLPVAEEATLTPRSTPSPSIADMSTIMWGFWIVWEFINLASWCCWRWCGFMFSLIAKAFGGLFLYSILGIASEHTVIWSNIKQVIIVPCSFFLDHVYRHSHCSSYSGHSPKIARMQEKKKKTSSSSLPNNLHIAIFQTTMCSPFKMKTPLELNQLTFGGLLDPQLAPFDLKRISYSTDPSKLRSCSTQNSSCPAKEIRIHSPGPAVEPPSDLDALIHQTMREIQSLECQETPSFAAGRTPKTLFGQDHAKAGDFPKKDFPTFATGRKISVFRPIFF